MAKATLGQVLRAFFFSFDLGQWLCEEDTPAEGLAGACRFDKPVRGLEPGFPRGG
jgi:hypothetical protein